jgi:hypothetical protein
MNMLQGKENIDTRKRKWIEQRIRQVADLIPPKQLEIIGNTTEFMNIHRGQVLELDGHHFLVTGNIYESRFGMCDEPKYWVKKAVALETGGKKIIKLVYNEDFVVHVGPLRIRCYRTQRKESQVLELVRGHPRFMQGTAYFDQIGNEVRVMDFIRGKSLLHMIFELNISHEEYFFTIFPRILEQLRDCIEAIQFIHDNGFCHGDIRNDHILIETGTENYRWIDFDLTQDFSDYDVWCLGNVLQFCTGMGMRTFHEVLRSDRFSSTTKHGLTRSDASAFYVHRIMNLQKLFPYIPDQLNEILLHFTAGTTKFYESAGQIAADIDGALRELSLA